MPHPATIEPDLSPAAHAPPKKAIPALTGLRFVAAFAVMVYHFRPSLHLTGLWGRLADEGRVGVCFFFILSGFILVYNYSDWFRTDARRAKEFYAARFARVFPMHFLALLLMTAVTACQWRWLPKEVTGAAWLAVAASWVANLFLLQAFLPRHALHLGMVGEAWNVPSWTLSLEMLFYVSFPFLLPLLFGKPATVKGLTFLLGAVLVLQCVSAVAVSSVLRLSEQHRLMTEDQFTDTRDVTTSLLRCWEFLVGCVLGRLYLEVRRRDPEGARLHNSAAVRSGVLAVVCLALLGIAWVPGRPPGGGLNFEWFRQYILWTPLFAAVIITLAFGPNFLTGLLERPVLILLGEASYSLYILHYIPWRIIDVAAGHGSAIPPGLSFTVIALTVALSVLSFRYVETPARRWAQRALARRASAAWRFAGSP